MTLNPGESLADPWAAAGLVFPSRVAQRDAADAVMSSIAALRLAWEAGDTSGWPSTLVPPEPLSVEEFGALADVVTFALRRATDGARASRSVAIGALALLDRMERASLALDALATLENPRGRAAAAMQLDVARIHVLCAILPYIQTHLAPDVAAADDPDAWLSLEQTSIVRHDLLRRLGTAHARVDAHLMDLETAGAFDSRELRLELLAGRLRAETAVVSVEMPYGEPRIVLAGMLSDDELSAAAADITACLTSMANDRSHPSMKSLALGLLAARYLLRDDLAQLSEQSANLANTLDFPLFDRINLLLTALSLGGSSDSEQVLGLLLSILRLVEESPRGERVRLNAHVSSPLAMALSTQAKSRPVEVSRLAGLLSGFGDDRARWCMDHPHVWLLPGEVSTALIDSYSETHVVPLNDLDVDYLLHHVLANHAEEFDEFRPFDELRRRLSNQLRPLTRHLAALDGPITLHAFGFLKHVPFASLTGDGAILAVKPGVRIMARRKKAGDIEPSVTVPPQRLFVLDDDLAESRRVPTGDAVVTRFNSSLPGDLTAAQAAFHRLMSGASEVFYFGHGHVDQFHHEHSGLVVDQTTVRLVPALSIAAQDWHGTSLAVVMACGAGQGNVFTELGVSVADGFCLAGVRRVIAPTWPIGAVDASRFLDRLLALLESGVDPEVAWARVLAEDPNRYCSMAIFGD